MTGFSRRTRRLLIGLTVLLSLSATPRPAEAGPREDCLAVMGSLVTMVPCVSPCACCLLGEVVGLWSIIVLISPPVRAAFPIRSWMMS